MRNRLLQVHVPELRLGLLYVKLVTRPVVVLWRVKHVIKVCLPRAKAIVHVVYAGARALQRPEINKPARTIGVQVQDVGRFDVAVYEVVLGQDQQARKQGAKAANHNK